MRIAPTPVRHGRRAPAAALGLKQNWRQFWLLVLINAFVGAMVGMERTVLPLLAESEFGIASRTAALSFIASFGLVKAIANVFAGTLSDRHGRKRVLLAGWIAALPVPLLVIWAPSWSWIVVANLFLGLSQGLAWSATVTMKLDLVGPKRRGFGMGLNEFAGYLAVAVAALGTGYLAEAFGLRPEPFYAGIACAAAGLALTVIFVRETRDHAALEASTLTIPLHVGAPAARLSLGQVFAAASWRDPALASASQAGMVNNLNDGLSWGLFPLFFAAAGLSLGQIGILSFTYPAVWGVLQLWTGGLSDRIGRKQLIATGMLVQGAALAAIAVAREFWAWVAFSALLGAGTAMVYPTLLASVADAAHPAWRASAIGFYRFWRDSGYVAGALVAGIIADRFGMAWSIGAVALLTIGAGFRVILRMPETLRPASRS